MLGIFTSALVAVAGVASHGSAPSGKEECTRNGPGYCTDPVVRYALSYQNLDPIVRINVALGKSLAIEFASPGMELATDPVLGNRQMLSTQKEARRILVWAQAPKEAGDVSDADLLNQRTNLQLDLVGNIHLIVEIRIGDEQEAVERLVLDFPERQQESEYIRSHLDEQERALRATYDRRNEKLNDEVTKTSKRQIAQQLLRRFQCQDLGARAMHDLVVVRANRICRMGNQVHIAFAVRNRSRSLFALYKTEVQAMDGNAPVAVPASVEYEREALQVGYDGEIRGIATIEIADDAKAANQYALVVSEDGGQGRSITLSGVGF